ncbi:MAG: nucleotidyltransferase family protein, partial [Candidatus Omnitrophica bacterium]|nr:nucleotidyltransferase family protein [Candidatus Omnitrophota bacterium]
DFGLKVAIFFEEQLLGSAGTVLSNRDFVKGEQDFLIIYADNLTDIDMGKLVGFHRERGSEFTMGLFHSKRPEECGIAELDENGRVVRFTEKPGYPEGDLANTGIYVSGQGIFDHIPDEPSSDFGFDVLPKLAGKMYGYVIESYYLDMGTVAGYEQACRDSSAGRI